MTDQEPIAAAILAALNAALPAGADAYDKDGVPGTFGNPGTVPDKAVVISLHGFAHPNQRFGGAGNTSGLFLDTGYRARNVQSCRELRRITWIVLQDQTVGGYGPLAFNDESQPIDDDADWGWFGVDTWQFC